MLNRSHWVSKLNGFASKCFSGEVRMAFQQDSMGIDRLNLGLILHLDSGIMSLGFSYGLAGALSLCYPAPKVGFQNAPVWLQICSSFASKSSPKVVLGIESMHFWVISL